jgi:hypothetical protein
MPVLCAIICNVGSQHLSLDSGHSRLLEPRANELEFELDIENNESVGFQISDFVHAGNNYTVVVTATCNGTVQTWTRSNGVSSSPIENEENDITIDITATAPDASTLNGGGMIRLRPKGKPD